jgi:hypothetical protein
VLLVGLVVRALGVALLTTTVLLPMADHHAAGRLPDVAHTISAHDLLAHHHGRATGPAQRLAVDAGMPAFLPTAPSAAEGLGLPSAVTAAEVPGASRHVLRWLTFSDTQIPIGLAPAPGLPPPIAAA